MPFHFPGSSHDFTNEEITFFAEKVDAQKQALEKIKMLNEQSQSTDKTTKEQIVQIIKKIL